MTATAIILARAGSKGLPGKNTAPLAGRPCLEWSVLDAQAAVSVSRVAVSSDDPRALELAEAGGAIPIRRPPDLASDTATVDAAARHAHIALGEPEGPVLILYANVPLRPTGLLDRAVAKLTETGAHSVQSYAPVGKHHPWWTARLDETSGAVTPWEGEVLNHGVYRRQELPPAYVPDAGVIAVTPDALHLRLELPEEVACSPHAFFGTSRVGIVTGEGEVIDIDSALDAMVAEASLTRREQARARQAPGPRGWRDAHR
ncbi:MAG: cytidylyltransferase domain-containing protein [Phycisphaerales bacterium JB040]